MPDALTGPGVFTWNGVRYKTILSPTETGGAMSIVDSWSPAGFGPPRHVHEAEDETFVLIEGSCDFWLEGKSFTCEPGESVFIPRGREHTFRASAGEPSRHLVIFTPGGFENFFVEMVREQFRIPDDMERINEAALRHNMRFTGPPLGVE
ncbi:MULTISPECIES: cupin domain-containing protein [unclassified Nitratireductor]|uniref:cupin domain-containing protein n=1 Tax=unclassified Nitratireductor TaxID=2641084 RepID=UPI0025CD369C|nr:cupin domain-containing protein [Nitratireductor sp.]